MRNNIVLMFWYFMDVRKLVIALRVLILLAVGIVLYLQVDQPVDRRRSDPVMAAKVEVQHGPALRAMGVRSLGVDPKTSDVVVVFKGRASWSAGRRPPARACQCGRLRRGRCRHLGGRFPYCLGEIPAALRSILRLDCGSTRWSPVPPACATRSDAAGFLPAEAAIPAPGSSPGSRGAFAHRGKSGPHRAGCRLTAGRHTPSGQSDGKCNREQTADGLRADQARVKRWGKSPPRTW